MNISPFLAVNHPCDETLQWAKHQLSLADLRTVQTFDLHAARAASHDCQCPNHGTDECDCQMVILLVYGIATEPETLILHGNNGQTWISMADTPNQKKNTLVTTAIRNTLEGHLPDQA